MKALILAGGCGTRLRPLTHSGAKQLVPVANRPILFYVVDNLVDAGITDIGVIVSPETGQEIRAALGDGTAFGANFTFILQPQPAGLAHAVAIAEPFLLGSDFVVYLGDNLIGAPIRQAASFFQANAHLSASILLKEVDDPTRFGVAELDADSRIARLVEKPKVPRSNLALVGIYFFRPSVFQAIRGLAPSQRGELEITDAITRLIESGGNVHYTRLSSFWLDTGKKDDLLLANDTVLDQWLVAQNQGHVDASSRLSGRVRIGPGARVEHSTLRGPVAIGEGATVSHSRVGPFTSVGDGVTIVRSTVEHSVIMQGASITDIARLEDSLIGKRVVVRPGPSQHGALSLLVGDDCVVELSSP